MIKYMKPSQRRLLSPVKKMADGGDMDWGSIYDKLAPAAGSVAPIAPSTIQPLDVSGAPQAPKQSVTSFSSSISAVSRSLAPFASNMVNALRTPPKPAVPHLDNFVTLQAPSYNNDRAEVSREINGTNAAIDRTVDGNTGAKIRLFNQGQKLERLSAINQSEHNTQVGLIGEQGKINAGISARNNEKLDIYGNQQVERQVAQQREQSANVANFSDKVVGIQNEEEKRRVDLEKTKVMSTLFSRSGVGDRERKILKEIGVPDPLGKSYSDLEEIKRNGGYMAGGGAMARPTAGSTYYRNIPLRGQTLKSLYKPAQ